GKTVIRLAQNKRRFNSQQNSDEHKHPNTVTPYITRWFWRRHTMFETTLFMPRSGVSFTPIVLNFGHSDLFRISDFEFRVYHKTNIKYSTP
ncbi:MAG: hypothetical protein ACE5IW_12540, partial [bacterium]